MTVFDADLLARGWLSVALASSTDKERPALNRTVHVELHAHGVRLAATDSYMILHSWVPCFDDELAPEPEPDEAPICTAVAMDPHGRGKGFLAHVLALSRKAADDDQPPVEVRLNVGLLPTDTETDGLAFEGMDARWVILELPDHEKITLQVHEGDFPNWRKIEVGWHPEPSEAVALNPDIVGRLAKLGKYHADKPLLWRWGGENKPAAVEVGDGFPHVSGLAMPVRWDFYRDAPADETPEHVHDGQESTEGEQ